MTGVGQAEPDEPLSEDVLDSRLASLKCGNKIISNLEMLGL